MPSSSARCSQLPRASDKVPFFVALRKLRDHLRGCLPHLDETEIVFPDLDLKVEPRKDRRTADEVSDRPPVALGHHSTAADRKRKHIDCNFNAVDVPHDRIYRPALPPSFPAVPQDVAQEFKWSSGFHKWPPTLPGIAHSNALVGMNSRMDCTYDSLLAKQGESQVFGAACGLLRGLPSAPFYGGWSDGQNRWTVNGLATRFNNDACYPVNIPTYLQYPDMISCTADRLAGHLPESSYRSVYPNLSAYSQESFLADPAVSAPSSAFSYNSSLNHDIKAPGSQLDPVFFQRPVHSPPSYYHQYR